ncbi:MAG: hypothetical protein IJU72_05920 [Bacteroidales bacterium]|nr:hypothetical protein [Bacteroidales bacterium]
MQDNNLENRGVVLALQQSEDAPLVRYSKGCTKLSNFDWLDDLPPMAQHTDIVEVQFKNTRKGFYRNVNGSSLHKGDVVAVEASPGHDIGVVSLTGWLVLRQVKRLGLDPERTEFKKIYRKAKAADVEKWMEAVALEHTTMIKSRQIAEGLGLNMKIGDVEYQGDRTKAIFYYIADDRVDFRELIKILAEEFRIRIEMRQIGARQEAGRIGGIGSCGRELCCSAWMANFASVSTNASKAQEISLNPQKMAGQCGKLKCCLNYELDCYLDARRDFPDTRIPLETVEGTYYHSKTDVLKRVMWYSTAPSMPVNLVEIPVDRVKEIVALNKDGQKVDSLLTGRYAPQPEVKPIEFNSVLEGSIDRFDNKRSKRKSRRPSESKRPAGNRSNRQGGGDAGRPQAAPPNRPSGGRGAQAQGARPPKANAARRPQNAANHRPERGAASKPPANDNA